MKKNVLILPCSTQIGVEQFYSLKHNKHFKLSKGGAILTDSLEAYHWFRRARYSGRRECSYHDDNFDMLGWNFYMMPELAMRGMLLMGQFYNIDGSKKQNQDLELPYPDLSKYEIYKQ